MLRFIKKSVKTKLEWDNMEFLLRMKHLTKHAPLFLPELKKIDGVIVGADIGNKVGVNNMYPY